MSQIALCLVDDDGEWWGEPHASEVDVVVAALAAEPETLGELEAAMQRFAQPGETIALKHWRGKQRNLEHGYDAGLCVVHLPGRLIACESTYASISREAGIGCGEREDGRELVVGYHLPDDWMITNDVLHWRGQGEARAEERLPLLDARPMLYDGVCEFIVDQCLAARNGEFEEWSPPAGWELTELVSRYTSGWHKIEGEPQARDAVAEIHARWLMTPRDELRGQSPREVFMAKRRFLSGDMEDRSHQWSVQGACPPPLHPETIAYRYAGFGTHEFLVHYDLMRELIWACWDRFVARFEETPTDENPYAGRWMSVPASAIDREAEIAYLREHRDAWLATPQMEDFCGQSPQQVIEMERRRIPSTSHPHEEPYHDDCPLCQMAAELPGPSFWFLDGCNNDDDFPFSCFHETYEEWEQEQRSHEERSRKWEEERRERVEAGIEEEEPFAADGIWQRSFVAAPSPDAPASVRLFGIGTHVAELVEDLRSEPESAGLIEPLNRCFGNLREVIETGQSELLGPTISRFCDELGGVSDHRTDLSAKCEDLAKHLRDLERVPIEGGTSEDDLPF